MEEKILIAENDLSHALPTFFQCDVTIIVMSMMSVDVRLVDMVAVVN